MVVEIDGGKVKFPRGKILYCGSATGAMAWFVPEMVKAIQAEAKGNIATGDNGHAAATGKHAIAASLGIKSTAMAGPDGWIVLAAYNDNYELVCVKAAKVGGPEGIEPNVSYRLTVAGDFVKAR